MGLNNENATRIVFDLETFALDDAAGYLEPVTAPANYKDPEKIAQFIAEKTASQVDRAALDLDLCRIVAIGFWTEGHEQPEVAVARTVADELELLQWFWQAVNGCHLVGFNCLNFDALILLRRSFYLGLHAPRLQVDRFKHPDITDLMQELSFGRIECVRSLNFYCKRLGIDIPDELTGADIATAVKAGEWVKVEAHCLADVQRTAALAERLGHFRQLSVGSF